MMSTKRMDFLAVVVLVVSTFISGISALPFLKTTGNKNSKYEFGEQIYKKKFCVVQQDCPAGYLCNRINHHCEEIKTIEQFNKFQYSNCPMLKNKCTSTSQCGGSCNGKALVCEQKECVFEKPQKKGNGELCRYDNECEFMSLCRSNRCTAVSLAELLLDLKKKHNLSSHHPSSTKCNHKGNSKCNGSNNQVTPTKQPTKASNWKMCMKQLHEKRCQQHSDCRTSCKLTNYFEKTLLRNSLCVQNKCVIRKETVVYAFIVSMKHRRKSQ